MPEIEVALHRKAQGRVLRSDQTPSESAPTDPPTEEWKDYQRRLRPRPLYFELTINDS